MTENHNSDLPVAGKQKQRFWQWPITLLMLLTVWWFLCRGAGKLNYGQSGRYPAGVDLITWGQASRL